MKYFPGKQLVPVAANVLFFNISCIMFPLLIGKYKKTPGNAISYSIKLEKTTELHENSAEHIYPTG